MDTDTEHELHSWHLECLRAMGFNRQQREALIDRLDDGELDLAELRQLFDERGWTPEQAFLSVA